MSSTLIWKPDEMEEREVSISSQNSSEAATGPPYTFDRGAAMRSTNLNKEVIVNHKLFQSKLPAASPDLILVETLPASDTDYDKQAIDQIHDDCPRRKSVDTTNETANLPTPTRELRKFEAIPPSQIVAPRSRYEGYIPPLPISTERCAVENLLGHIDGQNLVTPGALYGRRQSSMDEGSFIEFSLSDFAIYLPDNKYHPYEFRPLQDLASKPAHSCFLFDGILSTGNTRRYVQSVPFEVCSLGNYGRDIPEVGDNVWIQSKLNANSEIYYRLKTPAPEYARFYDTFKWLADFAKHFVDYCQAKKEKSVSVHNFRKDFSRWAQKTHSNSSCFLKWYGKHGSDDFRQAVTANIDFLFKESVGIEDDLRNHPIWSQLKDHNYIPFRQLKVLNTIVTPYVYECFKDLRFGPQLQAVIPVRNALDRCAGQGIELDLRLDNMLSRSVVEIPPPDTIDTRCFLSKGTRDISDPSKGVQDSLARWQGKIKSVQVGDVLSVTKDGENSVWKDEISRWKDLDNCWYIYVQDIHDFDGERSFSGIWLYKPSDTSCAKMKYLYPNELFLSDNCTCSEGRIPQGEVIDVVKVMWDGHPLKSGQGLFVRQTYLENERFVSLKDKHKKCEHLQHQNKIESTSQYHRYPVGQTVLAPSPQRKPKYDLEPCEVVEYISTSSKTFVVLRRLIRRGEVRGQHRCRANELVYTDKTYKIEAKKATRTCLVRFFTQSEVTNSLIPTPYDRDGTGNAFYITTRLVEHLGIEELEPIYCNFPQSLIEGFDPFEKLFCRLLRGLDLYCGGGNFGRGLEEGGALHNTYAVDCAKVPIHTYFANLKEPAQTKIFHGSVNDQFYAALNGNPKKSDLIPLPGDVDFISAGSPCQGFSTMNSFRNNENGLRNQSLVASVAAYIDFYRPKYGILENVMNMAQKGLGRDEDILSQLICAVVGLGYQLELFVLDAWSCGSPQSRSRIFVSFAAPGYEPLKHPELSHSHPPNLKDRGLGKLANGEPFGRRVWEPTPFNYVGAAAATEDLPNIGDGRTYHCTSFPDHVLSIKTTECLRRQILAIPTRPRGMDFISSWNDGKGLLSEEQRALFPNTMRNGKPVQTVNRGSKAWGRIYPQLLFSTICSHPIPACSRMGRILHWDQPRPATVMEARRAQSFPDDEVLVGSPQAKWALIGNSVARSVSLALGLSLREAWLKSSADDYAERIGFQAKESLVLTAIRTSPQPLARFSYIKPERTGPEIIIADSDECSDEDFSVDQICNRSMGNLPLRSTSLSQSSRGPTFLDPRYSSENSTKSLKRPHRTLQETMILSPQKNYKTSSIAGRVKEPSRQSQRSKSVNIGSGDSIQVVLSQDKSGNLDYFANDDDDEEAPEQQPVNKPNRYVPVDNRSFLAYAQTNRIMNAGKLRKHGPKSTW